MFTISFDKFVLPNGLQVILHEEHSLPLVAVNVWYQVGSKDEEVGRTGFAHLFEHMMFEGSKHHNKSFFEPLQKVGANLNGSTSSDRTNYWETIPANYLDLALWLESDRMGFLLDALDQSRFDIQRDVVKNERRQSYENRPYGMAQLALQPALFPAPHPYSWPTIGSQEDLDAASLEDIKDFFRRFYAPSNASLAIAGDIDPEKVRSSVERYFADIEPGPPINRLGRMDSELRGEVRLTVRDKVQLPRMYVVWPAVPVFDPDEAPLDVLAMVLGDGKSSRLSRVLVYEKQIARDVRVGNHAQSIAGEFHIQVTANPDHDLGEVQEIVDEELERIKLEPPTEKELVRAKNRVESERVRYLERIGGFYGIADLLNYYNVMAGDPGAINTDLDRYQRVQKEDISRVAGTRINSDRVRLSVLPEETHSVSSGAVDRSVTPKASATRKFTPPVPRRERLSNGIDVLMVEKRGLPMVTFGLMVGAGAVTDPADLPGLAHMAATMMPEGTATRSRQQIAEEMEFIGSSLDQHVGREQAVLSAEALTQHWPKALGLAADVVKNPSFPDEELERVRRERLTDLRRIADDPVAIGRRAGRALIYGHDTPYGHHASGTQEAVEEITRDQIVRHHQSHYGTAGATLLVVGDVAREDVIQHAEAVLGDWSQQGAGSPPTAGDADGREPTSTVIYLADKPGAAQSVIGAGQLTIPHGDPDFYAMTLLNYLFGGRPTARLFMNLREDKGYSYGYYSYIEWASGPSLLAAGGAVQTAVTKESVVETLKEFADIRGGRPVTREEFDDARDGMLRGFPSRFETQGHLVQQISNLVAFGLPDDYYSDCVANIEAVSLERLNEVAATRIDDSHLTVLVVGDRSVIEPGLQELGLPVVLVDYEGRNLT